MNQQSSARVDRRLYWLGLLAFPLFFVINYIFNHHRDWLAWLPTDRPIYTLTILLPFGTLLPALVLGWFIRRQDGNRRAFGATLAWRDLLLAVIGLALGLANLYFAVWPTLAQDPNALALGVHLFIWLLVASISEVMVFIGVVFHATETLVRQRWPGRGGRVIGAVSAILVSSMAFGLFHFSYYPPWDTWYWVIFLTPIWLMASTFYALTRSLVATIMFNNILAIVGFVRNGQTVAGSNLLGLTLDLIFIVAVIAIVAAMSASRKAVAPALAQS